MLLRSVFYLPLLLTQISGLAGLFVPHPRPPALYCCLSIFVFCLFLLRSHLCLRDVPLWAKHFRASSLPLALAVLKIISLFLVNSSVTGYAEVWFSVHWSGLEGSWTCGLISLVLENYSYYVIKYCFYSIFFFSSVDSIYTSYMCSILFSIFSTFYFFLWYWIWIFFNNLFFTRLFLKSSFRFTMKLRGRHRDFPYTPLHPIHSLLHYQYHSPEWYIFTKDEATLTHHNHPKFIDYIMAHSWCCILYE